MPTAPVSRPDEMDAQTVLAIHDLCVQNAGLPPNLTEVAKALGLRDRHWAWERIQRAFRHGWLMRLDRLVFRSSYRVYAPLWFDRMDWVLMRDGEPLPAARCPTCGHTL